LFNNRLISRGLDHYNGELLTFDHHPRQQRVTTNYGKKPKKTVLTESIYNCLDYFRGVEKLGKDNSWYCNVCKDHVEADKKIELYTVPPILVFCLQRFKSHNIYFKEKLEDKILFPVEGLDMTNYVLSAHPGDKTGAPLIYDLYAVSNHFGSLSFGHYTANCKNPLTGQWYDFNDSSVSKIDSPGDVVSGAAYVLYYKRRDMLNNSDSIDYEALKLRPDDDS
jgi:ubiquitin carboxyl-terminal hydrolase 4/11/15